MGDINLKTIFINFLITLVVYLALPVWLVFMNDEKYEKKTCIIIAIIDAILGYFIFYCIYSNNNIYGVPKILVALLYGYIAYRILYNPKIEDKRNQTKLNNEENTDKLDIK